MGGLGGVGAVLAAEICAPILLLCWLCCWPDDASDTSSGKYPARPAITNGSSGSHRLSELFNRRCGSSAISLHLPSTSGTTKQSLSAHRSHEEIRGRHRSQVDVGEEDSRYHSAPSVIHEVLHRRDWERSTKELYIPLKPEKVASSPSSPTPTGSYMSLDSIEQCEVTDRRISKTCKKHFTNIKCSKKKETDDDIKDDDATETSCFYIGDNSAGPSVSERPERIEKNNIKEDNNEAVERAGNDVKLYRHKETKQCLNECIKSKDRMRLVPVEELIVSRFGGESPDGAALDRSGAQHHGANSGAEICSARLMPPPSVEPLGYASDTLYLDEEAWGNAPSTALAWSPPAEGFLRARHASAGDVLAPTHRPQSGALSESDIDFELEACDELPPPYHEVHLLKHRNETAI
ncbi:uncharacterized protein LOC111001384 [Pieris rapae]|uniref:uncharacterized protein LOC111001384 n=1 Tax=Pieris rapae TaxID=64459 RepID=UPI001E27BA22|nr:uncharacterized protein LOC111001384 [Pieris rapae]